MVIMRRPVAHALFGLTMLVALSVTACGNGHGRIRIFAASSLQDVMPDLLDAYAIIYSDAPRFEIQYGGSQALATQIELGAQVDLFFAANHQQVQRIKNAGLVERTTLFAANRLVLVVAEGAALRSINDLGEAGIRIAIGAPDVPAGALTQTVLDALEPVLAAAIRANVVTEDPNVRIVLSRVELGEVDAGFVYRTDLQATMHVRAIELPADLDVPANEYVGAVIAATRSRTEAVTAVNPWANTLLDFLRSDEVQAIFKRAGFEVAE